MVDSATQTSVPPVEKFRKDYQPHDFAIDSIALHVELEDGVTQVTTETSFQRVGAADAPLCLDGEDLETLSVALDGRELAPDDYQLEAEQLRLEQVPDRFTLRTVVRIRPEDNTQLSGLYRSNGVYCTQCEAEGFRRITWSLDRPDVMTRYQVRIEADRHACPVLLSNGNRTAAGELPGGRHFAVWEDPFPKPSYLFALVAGDLGVLEGSFTTASGREVALAIYSEHRNVDKLAHALASLQRSMRWDEEQFGLEYDLDIYNIVAVEDFNMGAMENKSLNVFNTAYVLARPDTATDADFEKIEGVIAHEYFHNWTGNRVTCRDWFQLTLKEGLTVYRDQRFSADMGSAAARRIEAVQMLRAAQFPEDAGPLAHPIRPESYIAMDNFYTATVYLKGAEVVRLYEVLLGREGFRKGLDLYFARHDGQAVTCDDFRAAMADANQVDLSQLESWYAQAGTPVVQASGQWEASAGRYTLELRQETPATPGQPSKKPQRIPVATGLLSRSGQELAPTRVLDLSREKQSFVFEGLAEEPVPSLLRGFSAPVRVRMERSEEDLALLLAKDNDFFARWEAGQELARRVILSQLEQVADGTAPTLPGFLQTALEGVLASRAADPSLAALALALPAEAELAEEIQPLDPLVLHRTRRGLRQAIGRALAPRCAEVYQELTPREPYAFEPEQVGRRRLRNVCLAYLVAAEHPEAIDWACAQFEAADNMTDRLAALATLVDTEHPARASCLAAFERDWREDALVLDKWFALQAGACRATVLDEVRALQEHPAYSSRNPNKVRALLRSFAGNTVGFHAADGSGHVFLAEQILALDPFNPQIASRLVAPLGRWRRFASPWQDSMREQLRRIAAVDSLSKDTFEMVRRSLGDDA